MQTDATQPDCGLGYVVMFMMPAILVACALLGSAAGGTADWLAFVLFGIAFAIVPLLTIFGVNWDEPSPARPCSPFARLLYGGTFGALFAITVAHELIHHRSRLDRVFGGILLSTTCFGSFKIVHLRVHHRFVGTALDFSSARRGDSIYRFWLRCLHSNLRETLRCERERQRRLGLPW